MPVEVFTKERFEDQALPKNKATGEAMWKPLGIREGEYAYLIPLPDNINGIEVRSSVHSNGMSAESGKDSIRCWIVDIETGKPWGSKISRWTTRLPGWGERTLEVIRELWTMARKIVPCPTCKSARLKVFKVKKEGPNKGRVFLKCPNDKCNNGNPYFEWLGDEEKEVKESKEVKPVEKKVIAKTECIAIEIPADKRSELDHFLQSIGGSVRF